MRVRKHEFFLTIHIHCRGRNENKQWTMLHCPKTPLWLTRCFWSRPNDLCWYVSMVYNFIDGFPLYNTWRRSRYERCGETGHFNICVGGKTNVHVLLRWIVWVRNDVTARQRSNYAAVIAVPSVVQHNVIVCLFCWEIVERYLYDLQHE